MTARTSALTKAELADRLGGLVPFGPIFSVDDIIADEHFAIREMLPTIECEGLTEPMRIAGQPLKFSATPAAAHRRGPYRGEHTEQALLAHGVDADHIHRLRQAGVIPGAAS